jgi:hypothetical protein
MTNDDDRELEFKNAVTELLWNEELTETQLGLLRAQIGIPDLKREDSRDFAHQIVFTAFREANRRNLLLQRIPIIFPSIKTDLDKLIERHSRSDPETSSAPNDRVDGPELTLDEDEPVGAANEIASRVRAVAELRNKYRASLLEEARVDATNMTDLRGELLAALKEIGDSRDTLVRRSGQLPMSVRRLLSMLTRIEDGLESCLDAIIYYIQVGDSIENSRRTTPGVGITDADRATAELVRLRELNYSREQVRYRLARLSEDCERASSQFS